MSFNKNNVIEQFKSKKNKTIKKGNLNDGYWYGKLDKYGKKIIHGGAGPCQPKWGYCIKKSDLNEIHWAKNSKQVISFVKNYHK